MNMERDELRRLIDELPKDELKAARRYLEYLRDVDPVREAIKSATADDEPETDEEKESVEETKADIRSGRTMSSDQLKKEFGL